MGLDPAWTGVVGTTLGIILTQGFNIITDGRRRKREDRHRFTDDRRRVYSKYTGIMAIAGVNTKQDSEALQRVKDASFLVSEIRLIGGSHVVKAALALWDLNSKHVGSVVDTNDMQEHLKAFTRAAREEIGPPAED